MNESYATLGRKRVAVLKKMAKTGPFIMATATELGVRCGNPNCKCARNKKDRHEKLHLSWTDAEGNGTCYVPLDLRKEVLDWIENYWIIKRYMTEMTQLSRKMIKIYASTVGKRKRRQKKKEKRR